MDDSTLNEIRALGPTIAARSGEIETAGTIPRDLVDLLRPLGLFRQWVPAELGGPELSAMDALERIEELCYHDGSTGWCVAIATTSSLLASFLPQRWGREVFADPNAIVGGFAAPVGRATPVDGGLRVSGRWQWGSGTRHCTWIGGGCLVVDADGTPQPRDDGLAAPFVLFEPRDVELLDTWDVCGLEGTGSVDYVARDVLVPEGRWVELGRTEPVIDGPIARFSFFGLLALAVAATTVGIARRSIDELVELARTKRPQGSGRTLAERAALQTETALAEAKLKAAWGLMERTVEASWERSVAGDPPNDEGRRSLRLAATYATQTGAEVAASMYRAAGGVAVYRSSPLQRCFRDTAVATQHAMVAPRTFELVGRMRLGLETDTRWL